jgi:L-Lysine epsilon oxidase N-terminal/L-lysine epsilon oxidase C-terminal domain
VATTYKIHPGIGIARLGNSDSEFYLAPETPGALPQACDGRGNPSYAADGVTPVLVTNFRDAEGRIKRQAARFQIFVYDDQSPDGRVLKIGDRVSGGGNEGTLVDIQWRVYVANKKACWYEFRTTQGEHGYDDGHRRRNAGATGDRSRFIIDPGPRTVNGTTKRRASFDRSGEGAYATTFPPAGLQPFSIDTLGEMMTDQAGRLLVLGGHGRSGSEKSGPGEPSIANYANNDGWYDDVSDGPVMARLVMFAENVQRQRYIDVEYPAWVIVGYPRFVPEVLDVVTLDDVLYDLSLCEFADDTAIYGQAGSFDDPQHVDFHDPAALRHWQDGRLAWNPAFRPWFYRDIWPILYRPDQFRFLCNILGQSNFPHDQQQRGLFDPDKLGKTPKGVGAKTGLASSHGLPRLASVEMAEQPDLAARRIEGDEDRPGGHDEYGPQRRYLFGLLRLAGEENEFKLEDRVSSRLHNLPLMPLLCGDNPLTNVAPSKFLRLTDYQLFILKQWAEGKFINEIEEGWLKSPPYNAFDPYPKTPPRTGRELDRGVLSNALGGSFCPGGEVTWIIRNPSVYWAPYRLKADPSVGGFLETAAQANTGAGVEQDYTFNVQNPLSQDNNFEQGLEPGDVTKYMALPWQADFNECTTNPTDVTYADWNLINPQSENDTRLENSRKTWMTLWWPAHRPLQFSEVQSVSGKNASYQWKNWSRGIPQTHQGDLKMVSEWSSLPFIVRNPYLPADLKDKAPSDLDSDPRYVSVERVRG